MQPTKWETQAVMKCLALILLVLVALGACTPSDHTMKRVMSLELAANRDPVQDRTTLSLKCRSSGETIWLGGQSITMFANGVAIPSPTRWQDELRGSLPSGGARGFYTQLSPSELEGWLGGPGRYEIRARIGPVESNAISIDVLK